MGRERGGFARGCAETSARQTETDEELHVSDHRRLQDRWIGVPSRRESFVAINDARNDAVSRGSSPVPIPLTAPAPPAALKLKLDREIGIVDYSFTFRYAVLDPWRDSVLREVRNSFAEVQINVMKLNKARRKRCSLNGVAL